MPSQRRHAAQTWAIQTSAAVAMSSESAAGGALALLRTEATARFVRRRHRATALRVDFRVPRKAAAARRIARSSGALASSFAGGSQSRSASNSTVTPTPCPIGAAVCPPAPSLERPPEHSHYAGQEADRNLNVALCLVSAPILRSKRDNTSPGVVVAGDGVNRVDEALSPLVAERCGRRPDHDGEGDPDSIERRHVAVSARHASFPNSRATPDTGITPAGGARGRSGPVLQETGALQPTPRIVAQGGPPKGLRRFQVFASGNRFQAPAACDQCASSSVLHVCPSDLARQQ